MTWPSENPIYSPSFYLNLVNSARDDKKALPDDIFVRWFRHFLVQNDIKAIVFDFDNTIIKQHAKGTTEDIVQILQSSVSENFLTMYRLLDFFKDSENERLIKIACATFADDRHFQYSFGTSLEMLRKFEELNSVKFDAVEAFYPESRSKLEHLKKLSEQLNIPTRNMVLIDDAKKNVDAAINAGYWGFHVEKGVGIDFSSLKTYGPDMTPSTPKKKGKNHKSKSLSGKSSHRLFKKNTSLFK